LQLSMLDTSWPTAVYRRLRLVTIALIALLWLPEARADDLMGLMRQPGHIVFMRHAFAPFDNVRREGKLTPEQLRDCSTQRNLDDKGRADARRIGERLKRAGVAFDLVYTSAWCRCRETAALIIGREAPNLPLIDSFFTDPDKTRGPIQIAALKKHITEQLPADKTVLMVTHGSLISALSGVDTAETEVVIVARDGRGGVKVVGRGLP